MATITYPSELQEDRFPGNKEAYKNLVGSLKMGSVLGLVGAGASAPLYPTWNPFLRYMIDLARDRGLITQEAHIGEYERQALIDPLEVANQLEDIFTKDVFRSIISERFSRNSDEYTKTHRLIIEAGLRSIITINYDEGLENAYSAVKSKSARSIRAHDSAEIAKWLHNETRANDRMSIMHLHGVTADPRNMVLTGDDYNSFYSEGIKKDFIEQIWRSDRLLAVGFGFNDPFLTRTAEMVVRSMQSDVRHFALVGSRDTEMVSEIARRTFARKYRLTPIFYQIRIEADGFSEDHSDLEKILASLNPSGAGGASSGSISSIAINIIGQQNLGTDTSTSNFKLEFEGSLFVSPNNKMLYVEPRLCLPVELTGSDADPTPTRLTIDDICSDTSSYFVHARPEFGASTLCRRLTLELSRSGAAVILRDCQSLPTYKKKLIEEFERHYKSESKNRVIVLDDFKPESNERLLKEIIGLNYFERIIICSSADAPSDLISHITNNSSIKFKLAQLSSLERSDIRHLTEVLYDTSDTDYVSAIVEKVYNELLQLCIPLTPFNVIMYLQILYKEGDFNPLNRVQIIDRYVLQLLKKPSDDYKLSLNARAKADVVSAFVYDLFDKSRSSCTDLDWYNFCRAYKAENLVEFDERELLFDLIEKKILVKFQNNIAFKYRLFYSYFIGRMVANREALLKKFLQSDHHIRTDGLVEIIAGFSADGSTLVGDLLDKLEKHLKEFRKEFIPYEFDPFIDLTWQIDSAENDKIWKPLVDAVESGPKSSQEIDRLKTSLLAEERTAHQSVIFNQFDNLEKKLVAYHLALAEAINCCEVLPGEYKIKAAKLLIEGYMVVFQVGLLSARLIARSEFYFWNGIIFHNRMRFDETHDEQRRVSSVIGASFQAVSNMAANAIGTRKFGEVYKYICKNEDLSGFRRVLAYTLLIRSKPVNWEEGAAGLINKTDRDSLYIRSILYRTHDQFMFEVNSSKEREALKNLIAVIRARRQFHTNKPSSSLIKRVLSVLEDKDYFEKKGV